MTNLQKAASNALMVQDACNLSGVACSFLDAVKAVNAESCRLNEGTEWRNNHPIIRLFVDKLASLCGMQGTMGYENYEAADKDCRALIMAGEDMTETESAIAQAEGWDEVHVTNE